MPKLREERIGVKSQFRVRSREYEDTNFIGMVDADERESGSLWGRFIRVSRPVAPPGLERLGPSVDNRSPGNFCEAPSLFLPLVFHSNQLATVELKRRGISRRKWRLAKGKVYCRHPRWPGRSTPKALLAVLWSHRMATRVKMEKLPHMWDRLGWGSGILTHLI